MSVDQDQALAEALRDVYLSFEREGDAAIARLAKLYDEDVVFRDPLQTLRGRAAFVAMNRRILARARRCSFEVANVAAAKGSIFLAWTMLYEPRRGPTIVFEGATHARTRGGLIVEQRDYWDLLSSVAQSLPVVRDVYASLAPHLG
jgi:ketosteroid isomerase-like protein